MLKFAHVVRAPPERAWHVLVTPALRRGDGNWVREASLVEGRPGAVGAVGEYKTRRRHWQEALVEADAPRRLVFEVKDETQRVRAAYEWRLAPVTLGTHVVLEVRGASFKDAFISRWLHRWFYRRLVREFKRACEGEPRSVVSAAPAPSPQDAAAPGEIPGEAKEPAVPRARPPPARGRAAKKPVRKRA